MSTSTARLTVKTAAESTFKEITLSVTSGLPKWRSALMRSSAGGVRAKIACVGDSTTSGIGSNILSASDDSRKKAYPTQLATILSSRYGILADATSIWGNGNVLDISKFDPRISLGNGWAISETFIAGGYTFSDETNLRLAVSFSPPGPTDTLDVYYVTRPGNGNIEVSSKGAVHGAARTDGVSGVSKLTVKRAIAGGAWDIRKIDGPEPIMIAGIDAYDSQSSNTSVWNMGSSGSEISHWVHSDFAKSIPILGPDLTVICLTINDWISATPKQTYTSGVQMLIDAAKQTGDVLLMVPPPSRNSDAAPVARQKTYADYIRVLASKNNLPLIDMIYNWKSQESLWDKGFYFDGMHPSELGYLDIATVVAEFIGNP